MGGLEMINSSAQKSTYPEGTVVFLDSNRGSEERTEAAFFFFRSRSKSLTAKSSFSGCEASPKAQLLVFCWRSEAALNVTSRNKACMSRTTVVQVVEAT